MYVPAVRFILFAASVVLAVVFYLDENLVSMGTMLLTSFLFITGYFLYGTVFLAFRQMKKKNIEKAKSLLSKTKFPKWLKQSQRGYYHFVLGFIALNENRLDQGYQHLTSAVLIGLRTQNDLSIASYNVASVELKRGNIGESIKWIEGTRKFQCSDTILKELKKLEDQIEQFGANL